MSRRRKYFWKPWVQCSSNFRLNIIPAVDGRCVPSLTTFLTGFLPFTDKTEDGREDTWEVAELEAAETPFFFGLVAELGGIRTGFGGPITSNLPPNICLQNPLNSTLRFSRKTDWIWNETEERILATSSHTAKVELMPKYDSLLSIKTNERIQHALLSVTICCFTIFVPRPAGRSNEASVLYHLSSMFVNWNKLSYNCCQLGK